MNAEPEIWVVVCMNDGPRHRRRWGVDKGGPLMLETYTSKATKTAAMNRAAAIERQGMGACRIARLVFEDEQPKEPTK